jgi:hypothetical protein
MELMEIDNNASRMMQPERLAEIFYAAYDKAGYEDVPGDVLLGAASEISKIMQWHLDSCIRYWRMRRDKHSADAELLAGDGQAVARYVQESNRCEMCKHYVDAYQSMRNTLYDELLPDETYINLPAEWDRDWIETLGKMVWEQAGVKKERVVLYGAEPSEHIQQVWRRCGWKIQQDGAKFFLVVPIAEVRSGELYWTERPSDG